MTMGQKGTHTWDMILDYHCCPECSYIFESRQPLEDIFGKLQKKEVCPRCSKHFLVAKEKKVSFGPLIGEPQPIETEWGS